MKLSEAIRAGAAMRPQGFHDYIRWIPDDAGNTVVCTCALGAAYEASTGQLPPSVDELDAADGPTSNPPSVLKQFADVLRVQVQHPLRPVQGDVAHTIVSLNDTYKWTRERIADWLEQQGYEQEDHMKLDTQVIEELKQVRTVMQPDAMREWHLVKTVARSLGLEHLATWIGEHAYSNTELYLVHVREAEKEDGSEQSHTLDTDH